MSDFEAEREANIARNRALLAQLDVTLDIPQPRSKAKAPAKSKAKTSQSAGKKRKRSTSPLPAPRTRQSTRLRRTAPPINETPKEKRKREQQEEKLRKEAEEARLAEEERARAASKPRHDDLEMNTLLDDQEASTVMSFTSALQATLESGQPQRVGNHDDYEDPKEKREVAELKEKFKNLKIISRAKVTKERVYCAAYHPEVTKDLVFFGDKNGALGIWDARASPDTPEDDDEAAPSVDDVEGKHWRMQLHWPATAISSISAIKFNPTDSHSVFTSSYDCTVRCTSFVSGISREVFHNDGVHVQSFDIAPNGHEMWLSDRAGGVTHLDLREDKSKSRWYQLSANKIGCVSINPVNPVFLLTASNSKALRVWDVRRLHPLSKGRKTPIEINFDEIEEKAKEDKSLMRAEWMHGQSASSGYWDPHGRRIVSTSYDNSIKLWDIKPQFMKSDAPFPTFRPATVVGHDCQTGKWVTILRAQWSPNPDVFPHFTIGNMDRSLDVRTCKGELVAKLQHSSITAVQAVTCSHPSIVERVASGNASGRCVLWGPADGSESED
ncbi:WD40-repeat-containing domain protein [Irpex rosettiformis]|uniref:WD40-repeat-containing domain protein n=1 Tax=Irpex rosettiformis TaxID=378272 RepID=A0ACB8UHM6_9APHY|nr:WD40-repeat-containing domain protein [Irpex rosettiformis]